MAGAGGASSSYSSSALGVNGAERSKWENHSSGDISSKPLLSQLPGENLQIAGNCGLLPGPAEAQPLQQLWLSTQVPPPSWLLDCEPTEGAPISEKYQNALPLVE
ncbi:hypothetical protein LIER_06314 [Lithospermum erythrorhizon]|uniref:Uncharacterized protein n=1 Tax=Lithospermum erythrorhizon TaxID=34254 RepID=A0AAV3P7U1_LITER